MVEEDAVVLYHLLHMHIGDVYRVMLDNWTVFALELQKCQQILGFR